MPKKLLPLALPIATLCLIAGCASEVPLAAAKDANNPACANVTVRLPDELSGLSKRATNAQATGAWGDPASVILRCGIEPQGPTTEACVSVNGVDWVVDSSQEPRFRFVAYGREPGLEVFVDSAALSGTDVLLELAPSVTQLPQVRSCLNYRDTIDTDQLQPDN